MANPRTQRADFAAWYQDVVIQGDMAEPAEIVKGCMVIKANGYAVAGHPKRRFGQTFQRPGIRRLLPRNSSPQSFLRRAEHVEGFTCLSNPWSLSPAANIEDHT